jgi:hypothetical protein
MALLIDTMILLLLIGTLAYAFLVDRRVRTLMVALQALEPVVSQFSEAVDRTETSVKSLRAEGAARPPARREEEPPLTRAAAASGRTASDIAGSGVTGSGVTHAGIAPAAPAVSAASAAPGVSDTDIVFRSVRMAAARPGSTATGSPATATLAPGMARITGKSDLVRGFFDTIRSREA